MTRRQYRIAKLAVVLLSIGTLGTLYMTTLTAFPRMARCDHISIDAPTFYCREAAYWDYAFIALGVLAMVTGVVAFVFRPRALSLRRSRGVLADGAQPDQARRGGEGERTREHHSETGKIEPPKQG